MKLTKPDQGWSWLVLGASFGVMVINGCLGQGIGVVHLALLENFNEDSTRTALAGSLFAATQSCGGVFAGFIIKKYSCRAATIAGSLVMTAGFLCCVFINTLDLVILFYGGIAGAGAGLTYTTGIIVIGFNFEKRLNLAGGLAQSGVGLGVLCLSPVVQEMREMFGNKGFFFILAGISLHLCIFGTFYFPSQLEKNTTATEGLDMENGTTNVKNVTMSSTRPMETVPPLDTITKQKSVIFQITNVCRNIPFVMLCCSLFFAHFGIYIMFLNLPNYAVVNGASALQGSILISVSGVNSIIGRWLTGLTTSGNEVDEALLLFGTLSVLGVSNICLPLYGHSYEGKVLYSVFLGLYSGCCFPLLNGLSLRLVGLPYLATAVSVEMFSVGLGILCGPPCAGLFLDSGGTYDQCFIITGFIILGGAMFTLASEYLRTRRKVAVEATPDTILHL
ncbi:monocarboxylate transporter 12-like [Pecten maximus]|uniref:monocarboxylate transporter 12-like n=1 Tax=Pecten maximus TaxID=6579 RepID=UPI0014588789|nr:monocarboxylate transporter 12-like [Pecten maximus]